MDSSERPALANPGSCDELQAAATEAAAGLAAGAGSASDLLNALLAPVPDR